MRGWSTAYPRGFVLQGDARQVAAYYHPALRMDGTSLELDVSEGGGACGEWVEQNGDLVVAMTGQHVVSRKHE